MRMSGHVFLELAIALSSFPFTSGSVLAAARLVEAPLQFEPNLGQADPGFQSVTRGPGYAVYLASGRVVLNVGQTLRMNLIGAAPGAIAELLNPLPGVVSYLIGNDSAKWRAGVHTYGRVEYRQVYPGIDLAFYGNQRRLEYDFVVAPGADPSAIGWSVSGARAGLDSSGNLALALPSGDVSFERPVAYQITDGRKNAVVAAFVLAGGRVRFRLGAYDRSKPLVIDPVLSYATYLAGSGTDQIGMATGPGILQVGSSQGIAVDSAGSVYATGRTYSLDFPAKNGYQNSVAKAGAWSAAYVTKFSPDGSSLVYSTYIGGTAGSDYAYAIAVDANGEAYITGYTSTNDFLITPGAYQTVCSPAPGNQAPLVASCNSSNASAFVTKLNSAGTGLVYSTFLGGYGWSYGTAIAVDSAGRAYIAGNEAEYCTTSRTFQGCFPTTTGAVIGGNATGGGSPQYAFVAAFDAAGAHLLYSSLFGDLNGFTCPYGCGGTYGTGINVDADGYFYLIGNTQAGKLPTTAGTVQPEGAPLDSAHGVYLPVSRGFLAKFNPVTAAGGATLNLATYLGGKTGSTGDYLSGIATDHAGNIYAAGYTNSADFPVTGGAFSTICGQGGTCSAAHITKLNSTATSILWSTYVGGANSDGSDAVFFTGPIQLDGNGNVYILGKASPGFPLLNPVEAVGSSGAGDVIVVELDPAGGRLLFASQVGSGGRDSAGPGGLVVDSKGDIYVAGNILGPDLITTPGAFQTTAQNTSCCYHGYVAKIAPTSSPQINVRGTSVDVFNAATLKTGGIAPNEYISLKGSGLGPATGAVSTMTTSLSGASVLINGTPAYLTYAQEGQINVLVPFSVSGLQNATIQAEYNGVKGNTVTVPVTASSPGIFTQSYGPGQAWIANQDNTFNSSSNPAPRGTYVAFWITGQGLVNTTLADGTQPSGPPYPTPMLPLGVALGGVQLPAANIAFDGLIYCGEVQVNILIPANAPTGSAVPLVVTIGAASSRADATIAIQ